MEHGVVNLLNGTADRFDHTIICLRTSDPEFRQRIRSRDVQVFELNKRDGNDPRTYLKLFALLRRLSPDIVHTRNLPTIDLSPIIRAAGIARIVHGEHGRDLLEPDGNNRRYNFIRRTLSPLIDRYICVSQDLGGWLGQTVGVPRNKIEQIYNGVDIERFRPSARSDRDHIPNAGPEDLVIGTVGRMEGVKDQLTLAHAFVELVERTGSAGLRLKLVMVGDGRLYQPVLEVLQQAGLGKQIWLPGARHDVPDLIRELDIFVLPSQAEGISNTILEAMASGLPVVATAVGGNTELVTPNVTGTLVPSENPSAMARALLQYVNNPDRVERTGEHARRHAVERFSLPAMVRRYAEVYDSL